VSAPVLKRVTVTFGDDGDLEVAVTYTHDEGGVPNPGTKKRVTAATRMASEGLQCALEALGSGPGQWGGFGANTKVRTDRITVERSSL
jgi:hypothetical protein